MFSLFIGMVFSQSIVLISWAFPLEGILMWVRTALLTSLTDSRSWLIEQVRVAEDDQIRYTQP